MKSTEGKKVAVESAEGMTLRGVYEAEFIQHSNNNAEHFSVLDVALSLCFHSNSA